MQATRALRSPKFTLLWTGQSLSRIGDHVYRVALAWWVLSAGGSPSTMATVFACSMIPQLALLLVGGVFVDRFNRTRVMLASDLLRGTIVAIITILAATHSLVIWHVYVASMLFGTVAAFFDPAVQSILPELVETPILPSANAMTSLSQNLTGIIGPMLGAAVLLISAPLAFGLNAASFFLSALCLIALPTLRSQRDRPAPTTSTWHDAKEGWQIMHNTRWLWITMILTGVGNVAMGGPFAVSLPFLISERFGNNVSILGSVFSAYAVGSVLTALWMGRYQAFRHRGLLLFGSFVAGSLIIISIGFPLGLVGLLVAAAARGVMHQIFNMAWYHSVQQLIPSTMLGRVNSVDLVVSSALLPIGYALAGIGTPLIGPDNMFLAGGVISLIAALYGLCHPAIRSLD